jgi:hypothetical protein
VDVEVAGGAVRGDGHAVPGQQRVVVDDREVGRGEADLVAEQCRAGLGPVEVMSVAGAQGRGGDGLAGPADRAAMLGQDGAAALLGPTRRPSPRTFRAAGLSFPG